MFGIRLIKCDNFRQPLPAESSFAFCGGQVRI